MNDLSYTYLKPQNVTKDITITNPTVLGESVVNGVTSTNSKFLFLYIKNKLKKELFTVSIEQSTKVCRISY